MEKTKSVENSAKIEQKKLAKELYLPYIHLTLLEKLKEGQ